MEPTFDAEIQVFFGARQTHNRSETIRQTELGPRWLALAGWLVPCLAAPAVLSPSPAAVVTPVLKNQCGIHPPGLSSSCGHRSTWRAVQRALCGAKEGGKRRAALSACSSRNGC